MAVIGSIRKRGTLLLVIVGISMLAFILGDQFFQRMFQTMPDTAVAKINGTNINYEEYGLRLELHTNRWMAMNPQGSMTDEDRNSVSEQAWFDIIQKYLFGPEYKKLGIFLSAKEINDLQVGVTADEQIKQNFMDPATGVFDAKKVQDLISQLAQDINSVPEQNRAMFMSYKAYYQKMLEEAIGRRQFEKYNSMVRNGFYVTTKEAERINTEQTAKVNLRFVAKTYASIPDSTIEYTTSDLKKYFNENIYKFKGKRSREVSVALFSFNPTSADTAIVLNSITELMEPFKTGSSDTLFATSNSDNPMIPGYYRRKSLIAGLDTTLFDGPTGEVFGPVRDNQFFTIAKKLKDTLISDSARVYHLLVKVGETRDDSTAKYRIDSLMNVIKTGGDFYTLALNYSEDEGSVPDSGKIGWVAAQMNFDPIFRDSSLAGKAGEYKIARSQFGYHIIKIEERTALAEKVLVAQISKEIVPSKDTKNAAYQQAGIFGSVDYSEKDFDGQQYFKEKGREMGILVLEDQLIRDDAKTLSFLKSPVEIIKWSQSAKIGEISPAFESGYNYVIATVNLIRDYGTPKFENVKAAVKKEYIRAQKAAKLIEEFNAAISSGITIDALASKLQLTPIPSPEVSFKMANVAGAGQEFKLVGTAFAMSANTLSAPIEGERGVYVFVVDGNTPAAPVPDITAFRKAQSNEAASRLSQTLYEGLMAKAKMIDRRITFE